MARVCINCGKKIGMALAVPMELCNGQVLCSGCAATLRPLIRTLYSSRYNDNFEEAFTTTKEKIICTCTEKYNEVTVAAVAAKIDEIYNNELAASNEKPLQFDQNITNKVTQETRTRIAEEQNVLKETQMLTTGFDFSGYKITKYIGVMSGEVVLGTGFLSEFSASISDLLGAESSAFAEKLESAKDAAIEKLKLKSAQKGGNAIIGIDFDYVTFASNMIGVIANGTSVVIEKME